MADPQEEHRGPKSYGGSPVSLMIYVEDVDHIFRQARIQCVGQFTRGVRPIQFKSHHLPAGMHTCIGAP